MVFDKTLQTVQPAGPALLEIAKHVALCQRGKANINNQVGSSVARNEGIGNKCHSKPLTARADRFGETGKSRGLKMIPMGIDHKLRVVRRSAAVPLLPTFAQVRIFKHEDSVLRRPAPQFARFWVGQQCPKPVGRHRNASGQLEMCAGLGHCGVLSSASARACKRSSRPSQSLR